MPRRFGRYEVQREIGDGAMGRVYRCLDPLMKRVVAIKTVKKEYLTRDTRDEYLRRFRREAQAAGRLSHPNIVSVFDVAEDFFVMEYLEGSTLQVILRERGQLPPEDALRILSPLAEALDYAHRSGIVHRDIKPGNIFVLADGRPKLMDFGVAHLESSAMTAQGHFFGSPSYMAPEQVSGSDVAAAADVFSFGVVAYEMITGHRPFEGASITAIMYRVVNEEPPPPRQWDFALPPVFDDIFRRALSKNPAERFPDATSLVRALERREFAVGASEAAAALTAGGAGLKTLEAAPARSPAAPTVHPMAWAPAPASVAGALETHDLQPADAGSRTAAMRRPRRAALAVGAVMAAAALALYLGRASEPAPAEPAARAGPSVLRIETEPAGASVWLDGQEAGRAPVAWPSIRPGVHKVRVAADGYAPAGLTLVVRPGEAPPPLRFVMEPLIAKLRVRSEPPDAVVRIDGQPVGNTPLDSIDLAPGPHEVRLERRGFSPASQAIEARAGETVEVSLRLDPRVGPPPSPSPIVAGMLVPLAAADVPPRRIKGEAPPYPEMAKRFRMEGSVTVEMIVDENGQPQDLRIVESASDLLDRAVIDAVRRWRYEPARKSGVNVKVRTQAKITFNPPS